MAPQLPTKRYPWSKPKVQHRPTRKDRKNFRALVARGNPPA